MISFQESVAAVIADSTEQNDVCSRSQASAKFNLKGHAPAHLTVFAHDPILILVLQLRHGVELLACLWTH